MEPNRNRLKAALQVEKCFFTFLHKFSDLLKSYSFILEKFFHDELIPEVETLLDVVADLNEKALGSALKVLEAKAKKLEAQKDICDGEIHFL